MTRREYIDHLTAVYRQANLADSDQAQPWQRHNEAISHCRAIETIMRDLLDPIQYQRWLDNL